MITSPGVNNLGIVSPVINELFTLFDASLMLIVVVMILTISARLLKMLYKNLIEIENVNTTKLEVMRRNAGSTVKFE